MKLPLFVAAVPAPSLSSPTVLLKKGNWRLTSNHTTSQLKLMSKSQSLVLQDGMEFEVTEEYLMVWILIEEKGKESTISVSLETVRKDDRDSGSINNKP